nr:uncharacterized protein LOC111986507 [Quercus suber]
MEGNEIERQREILVEGEKKPPSEVVVAVSQPCRFRSDPNQRRLGFGFREIWPTSSYSVTCAVGSIHPSLSKALKKWTSGGGGGGRAPRCLILGLGVSFWTQYMSMAVVLLEGILSLPLLGKRVLLKRASSNN